MNINIEQTHFNRKLHFHWLHVAIWTTDVNKTERSSTHEIVQNLDNLCWFQQKKCPIYCFNSHILRITVFHKVLQILFPLCNVHGSLIELCNKPKNKLLITSYGIIVSFELLDKKKNKAWYRMQNAMTTTILGIFAILPKCRLHIVTKYPLSTW